MENSDSEKEATCTPSDPDLPETITFDFIKSNYYREILVTGVYGGVTPHKYIQLSIFNERQAIPKQTSHKVSSDGTLSDEIREARLSRESIIRSVEATLFMDINTAEQVVEWMSKNIKKAKQIENIVENDEQK